MIYTMYSFSIKQTIIVSECYFVASLDISVVYERRFNKKLITSIIYLQNKHGDVLSTASMFTMTEAEGEKCGLIPTHGYAVLDVREFKRLQFVQLKNPWSHLRWKGTYNENDVNNWTLELQKYLNFDPRTAHKIDNGIFWISWDGLWQYCDVIYLSWNPGLFKESTCIHSSWDAKQGPWDAVKDAGSLANWKCTVHRGALWCGFCLVDT